MTRHRLSPLFEPASIALVGASERPGSPGLLLHRSLAAGGYRGTLGLVNPRHATVSGERCWRDVRALPFVPELAIVAAPIAAVARVVADCAAVGTRFVMVASPGFELDSRGGEPSQATLLEAARSSGVRLLGPNCRALMRPSLGFDASFAVQGVKAGRVALVSQSGAVVTALVDWANPAGIGFSSVVSLGSSIDLDFGELLDFYLFDAQTDSVLLYLEGVRDARRFMSSVRALSRVKPVVIMKADRRDDVHRIGVSHSEALTGNDRVFDAAIARAGAVRAATTMQLLASAKLLALRKHPVGPRLAILSNGSGPGVIAADAVLHNQLELAQLSPATWQTLDPLMPPHTVRGNPVNLAANCDAGRIEVALRAMAADDRVDSALMLFVPQALTPATDAAQAIIAAAAGTRKPLVAVLAGAQSVALGQKMLDAAGVPHFLTPENAVDALALLDSFGRNQKKLREVPGAQDESFVPDTSAALALYHQVAAEGRSRLDEIESKRLLQMFGIAAPPSVVVRTPDEAAEAAAAAGFPVVLKILSPDILHKSDVGGVRIDVHSVAAAHAAAVDILESVGRLRPEARLTGIVVQPMIRSRNQRELYLGMATDPMFGAVIAFGAGGVAVERLDDVAIGLPPLNALLARSLVQRTRVERLLHAYRNVPAIDLAALDRALVRLSSLVCACPWIESLDINPLVADEHHVIALDAQVEIRAPTGGRAARWRGAYGHLAIHPYPRELEERIRLRTGDHVLLRPIRPEDATLERAFVASLSPQTLYRRFMMPVKELSDAMIERFTQIDYDRELALVALMDGPEKSTGGPDARMVAVARIIPTWDDGAAEFAIVVGDSMHRSGIGRELMLRLFDACKARGYRRLEGFVLAENTGMLRFCERLGFTISADPQDPTNRIVRRLLA
jgi:acetyltransferase